MKETEWSKYQKHYLADIPLADYRHYDDSSKELAIVIPLTDGISFPERLPFFAHGAVAVRHSLVTNTDIVTRKVPVYFLVENIPGVDLAGFLMEQGVPEDRICRFASEPPIVKELRLSGSFYMLKDAVLKGYKHIVKWDADLFACCDPEIGEKHDTTVLQTNRISAQKSGGGRDSYEDIPVWWDRWDWTDDNRTCKDNFEKTRAAVKKLSGYEIGTGPYHDVIGGIISYPAQALPDGFLDFIFTIEPATGCEELTFAIWCEYSGQSVDLLDLIKSWKRTFATNWRPIPTMRENGPYWVHLYYRSNDKRDYTREKSLFYRDIGVDNEGFMVL